MLVNVDRLSKNKSAIKKRQNEEHSFHVQLDFNTKFPLRNSGSIFQKAVRRFICMKPCILPVIPV
jgi:hypothetical protein